MAFFFLGPIVNTCRLLMVDLNASLHRRTTKKCSCKSGNTGGGLVNGWVTVTLYPLLYPRVPTTLNTPDLSPRNKFTDFGFLALDQSWLELFDSQVTYREF